MTFRNIRRGMNTNLAKVRRLSDAEEADRWHRRKLTLVRAIKEGVSTVGAANLPYLCKTLDTPHSTTYQYLQKLIKEKLVTYDRGKGSTFRLTEKGLELAERCLIVRNGESISVIERIV